MIDQVKKEQLEELVNTALQKAFQFGQTYWRQAVSDSYKENNESVETMNKFNLHVLETIFAISDFRPDKETSDE